jgi:hypothetical protein
MTRNECECFVWPFLVKLIVGDGLLCCGIVNASIHNDNLTISPNQYFSPDVILYRGSSANYADEG